MNAAEIFATVFIVLFLGTLALLLYDAWEGED